MAFGFFNNALLDKHKRASDVVLVCLIIIPLVVISVFAIRSVKIEKVMQDQRVIAQNNWFLSSIDTAIQAHIETKIATFFQSIAVQSGRQDRLRFWVFNQSELDLAVVYGTDGERIFPPEDQSTLIQESILLGQLQGELTLAQNALQTRETFRAIVRNESGVGLLACNAMSANAACLFFGGESLDSWIQQAFAGLILPSTQQVSIIAPGNISAQSNKSMPVALQRPMSGIYSAWQLVLHPSPAEVTDNHNLIYVALLLPIFLVMVFCSVGLYWMVQIRAKQTEEQKQFSAELAHEVRTPLANIRLYVELIKRKPKTEQDDYCAVLNAEIDRLSRLVDNAILMAKPENSANQQKFALTEPDRLISSIIETMAPALEQNGCKVELDLQVLERVELNRDALQRIVINLVDNAQKYAKGCPIRITSALRDKVLVIDIADKGPGLSNQLWRQIQDPKSQRIKTGGLGFGLGLRVCIKLIQQQNGDIELIPAKQGTHFRITLPINQHISAHVPTVAVARS